MADYSKHCWFDRFGPQFLEIFKEYPKILGSFCLTGFHILTDFGHELESLIKDLSSHISSIKLEYLIRGCNYLYIGR